MVTICPVKLLHMSYLYEYEALFKLQEEYKFEESIKVPFGTQLTVLKLKFEILRKYNQEHWNAYKLVNPFDNLENKE